MIDHLLIQNHLSSIDYGIIGTDVIVILFALTTAYLITNRGEDIRLLLLPLVLLGNIIGFRTGPIALVIPTWIFVSTLLNRGLFGETLDLKAQSKKKQDRKKTGNETKGIAGQALKIATNNSPALGKKATRTG